MDVIDNKFSYKPLHYFVQCIMAALVIGFALYAFGTDAQKTLIGAIGASSLGASSFIVFSAHNGVAARSRNLIGGYLIGIIVGISCHNIALMIQDLDPVLIHTHIITLVGAFTVGAVMFFMVLGNFEHPPAAGLALGLVIERWTLWDLMVIMATVLLLIACKIIFKRWLINLLGH